MITVVKVLSERRFKAGYVVRHELWAHESTEEPTPIRAAYNTAGDYIGDPKEAFRLWSRFGIRPEKANPAHVVCSIGFSERYQKWYGWSHRAIYGYGVGDVIQEGSLGATSGWTDDYLAEHPEENLALPVGFVVRTLDDAKRAAIAFAEAVS
jgi:hypothetical protein